MTVLATRGDTGNGIGTVDLSLDPDPATTPIPVTTYDDPGTTITSFTKTGTDGTAGLYRLVFTSTTNPCPATITATLTINDYGTVIPAVLMAAPGTLDTTFADPNLATYGLAVAVQDDQKILVAGGFSTAAGQPYGRLARFNTDGTLDTTFTNPNLNLNGAAVAVQDDQKILVAGEFTTAAGQPYGRLARFNTDGTLDTTFTNPDLNGTGAAVAVQSNQKILVAGQFTEAAGQPYGQLARFNTDGTLDTTFTNPNLTTPGLLSDVDDVLVQADGKILVAGTFSNAGPNNTPYGRVARFNTDGTLDTTFTNPNLDGRARHLALQTDQKILVAGSFTSAGGLTHHLARFNANGTLDTTFTDPNLSEGCNGVAVQSDQKILVAGLFVSAGGQPYERLARLNIDGTPDNTFTNPNLNSAAVEVVLQSDGQILVTGFFSAAGTANTTYGRLARFNT